MRRTENDSVEEKGTLKRGLKGRGDKKERRY